MGRGGSRIFLGQPIGIKGQGICIGTPGVTLFNDTENTSPTDGSTVNFVPSEGVNNAFINGATTLAALTITINNGLSTGATQQLFFFTFNVAVTSLTFSGANIATSPALPTTAAIGSQFGFGWNSSLTQWVRVL